MTKQDMLTSMHLSIMELDKWRYWICTLCDNKIHDKDNLTIHKIDGLSKIVCKECVVDFRNDP